MGGNLLLDVAAEHVTFWWVTLGLGAVVISAVILLLSLLVTFVDDIDKNVREVWDTATRVAQNTATTWMLTDTSDRLDMLVEEAVQHEALFERGGST